MGTGWHDFVDLPVLDLYRMVGRSKNGEKRGGIWEALCINPAQRQIAISLQRRKMCDSRLTLCTAPQFLFSVSGSLEGDKPSTSMMVLYCSVAHSPWKTSPDKGHN